MKPQQEDVKALGQTLLDTFCSESTELSKIDDELYRTLQEMANGSVNAQEALRMATEAAQNCGFTDILQLDNELDCLCWQTLRTARHALVVFVGHSKQLEEAKYNRSTFP